MNKTIEDQNQKILERLNAIKSAPSESIKALNLTTEALAAKLSINRKVKTQASLNATLQLKVGNKLKSKLGKITSSYVKYFSENTNNEKSQKSSESRLQNRSSNSANRSSLVKVKSPTAKKILFNGKI